MTGNVVVRSARVLRNCSALLLLVLVLWPAQLAAQAPGRGRLKVLFLGDNGHHRPYQRAKESLAGLAQNGIDLFYTDEREDLNATELDKYHVLMLYNNHTTVAPAQLQSLLEFVRDGGGLVVLHCASASFQNSEEFIDRKSTRLNSSHSQISYAVFCLRD